MNRADSLKGRGILFFGKNAKGVSIVELLVSVAIMGIAIAGISELLWANTSWLTSLHNKFDSFYAAKSFCNRVERDLNQCLCVEYSPNDSPPRLSDSANLYLKLAPESSFDQNGFLTRVKPWVYWVEPDTEAGYENSYVVKAAESKVSTGTIVLKGLVGPKGLIDGKPKLFQFVDKFGNVSDFASESTRTVYLNLELRRTDYGKSSRDVGKSGIVIRQEVLLRNANLHNL